MSVNAEEGSETAAGLKGHERRPLGRCPFVAEDLGELRHGRRREEGGERDPKAEGRLDLGEQTHGQERMPPEVEEVVPHAAGTRPEHALAAARQPDLETVARILEGALVPRPGFLAFRAGPAIDL